MELALANSIKAMSLSMENTPDDYESKMEKQREYEQACREKFSTPDKKLESESKENSIPNSSQQETSAITSVIEESHIESKENSIPISIQQETSAITSIVEESHIESIFESDGEPLEEMAMLSYPRKVTVIYELLSACLADTPEDDKNSTRQRKGYDARHRVALRLLATWFDVKWITVVHFTLLQS